MGKNQGIKSKNVTRPEYKSGHSAHGKNVRAVSQMGQALGNTVMDRDRNLKRITEDLRDAPRPLENATPLGNTCTQTVGCGAGRKVMPSGGQGQW